MVVRGQTPSPKAGSTGAAGLSHLETGRSRASALGVLWSFVNVASGTLISTLVFLVTSRVLAPEDFGLVALALSLVMVAAAVLPTGYAEALVQRAEVTPEHLDAVFWLLTGVGATMYLLLVLAAGVLADLAGTPGLAPVLQVIGLKIVFDCVAGVPMALLSRRMAYKAFALRTVLANGLGGLVCLALVWAGYGFWALAVSQVVGSAINAAVVCVLCDWRPGLRLPHRRLRDLRSYGLSTTGVRAVTDLRLDQIALGALAGPGPLGLYFFARRLFEILTLLTMGVFSPVTHVLFASMQEDDSKSRNAFLIAAFSSSAFGLPIFAGLLVMADTAVPLVFGSQWTEAVLGVQAFALMGALSVLSIAPSTLINARGLAPWWLGYQTALQVSALPLVLVVYPSFGFDATMGALLLRTALLWPFPLRKALSLIGLDLRSFARSVTPPVVASLAAAGAATLLPRVLPGVEGWARFGAEVTLGGLAYGIVLATLAWPQVATLTRVLRRREA